MRPIDADKLMDDVRANMTSGMFTAIDIVNRQPTIESIPLLQVGDEIWYAFKDGNLAPNGYYEKQKITEIRIKESGVTYVTSEMRKFPSYYIGKLYFRSYEEAKETLNPKEIADEEREVEL